MQSFLMNYATVGVKLHVRIRIDDRRIAKITFAFYDVNMLAVTFAAIK